MLLAVAALGATLLGAVQASDYVGRFAAAFEALERGDHDAAASGFRAAGELAPAAPVWRASLGVTLARQGRVEEAREQLALALAAGYPPSDLAALHPMAVDVVRASPARELDETAADPGFEFVRARFAVDHESLQPYVYEGGLLLAGSRAVDVQLSVPAANFLATLVAARAALRPRAPAGDPARLAYIDHESVRVRVLYGELLDISSFSVNRDLELVIGCSYASSFVFDAGQLEADSAAAGSTAPAPLPGIPPLELMLVGTGAGDDRLAAVACDGAFDLPVDAFHRARVRLGEGLVSAASLAPWLYDPLHVRTLLLDDDRRMRGVPKLVERMQALAAAQANEAPSLSLRDYPRTFLAALALLDEGEARGAAEAFEQAGSCAPHAPVWRVHAGVARALAGERDAALAHFVAALDAGYPLDDLDAIAAGLPGALRDANDQVPRVIEIVLEAAQRAALPDESVRAAWRTVNGKRHVAVPFSAEARDHGSLLELAYEGRPRRTAGHSSGDTGMFAESSTAALPRHHFLDPATLAVVARLVPPRSDGSGYLIEKDGTRRPLPDPMPIWVDAQGEYLDQQRFRALVRAEDVPGLDVLTRGLRSGVWVASTHRIIGVSCHRDVRLFVAARTFSSAFLDVAQWRLGELGFDALGPPDWPSGDDVYSGTLAGADAATLVSRASALGLRSLSQCPGGGLLFGLGSDAVAVLDPDTVEPIASLWLHHVSVVVVAVDGTFAMGSAALDEALVTVDDAWVPARIVAPWLLDPLHLRCLAHDESRAARGFPVR